MSCYVSETNDAACSADRRPSVQGCPPGRDVLSETESLLNKNRLQTPVPKLQLATLCLVRLVDPISFTQIFPYVNQMIESLGVAKHPSQVGFYSGVIDSAFAVCQLLAIYPWAKLSDTVGRRPVILAGTLGIAFTTFLFGLSRTFGALLWSRCLAGLLAGNVATMHAVMAEITDHSNQAVALPIYGLVWPIGSVIGPLIGGTFANPSQRFRLFDGSPLWGTFPYLLPCVVCAVVALLGVCFGWFFLEETLPEKRRKGPGTGFPNDEISTNKAYGTVNRTNATQVEQTTCLEGIEDSQPISADEHAEVPHGMLSLLSIPSVRALSASGFTLAFLSGSFDVVFVLFCFSPVDEGGLDYPAAHIGYALAIAGISASFLHALVMPSILKRFETLVAYRACNALWPIAYAMLPCLNLLARLNIDGQGEQEPLGPRHAALVWIGIAVVLAITRVANMAFSLSLILVKETAPNMRSVGAANGLAQFAMCLARAAAPAFVSALFAVSVDRQLCGGVLWVFVMISLSLVGIQVTKAVVIRPPYDLEIKG